MGSKKRRGERKRIGHRQDVFDMYFGPIIFWARLLA